MNTLFKPAKVLMDRVRYPVKFAIIFFIILIPLTVLSVNMVTVISDKIDFLERERLGLTYIKTVRQPIEHIQQHRGMTAAYLNGATEFRERIMQKRRVVDEKLAELKAIDRTLGAQFGSGDVMGDLLRQWNNIKSDGMNMSTNEAIKVHSVIISHMLTLMSTIADNAKITLDPELDSAHIGNALVSGLPNMLENMGKARAVGAGVAAQGHFSARESYTKLAVLANNIGLYLKRVSTGLEAAYQENSELAKALARPTEANNNAIRDMEALLSEKLLNAETITVSSDQVFDTATTAISGSYKLYDALVPALDRIFVARIDAYRTKEITAIAIVVVVLALLAYLFTGFYFSVRHAISQISDAAEKLSEGDLTVYVDLSSRDEMTQVGAAINAIAKGVGQTVSSVVSSSDQFVSVADRLAQSSYSTGNAAESQVKGIEETAHAVEQMANAVQDVTANIAQAATTAQKANDTGINGQRVVGEAVESINTLANDLNQVAGVIHSLEERSQDISGILEVIRDIAEQTNLLALNAAIEAARAGEQGRGFAVVADEVRGLAGRTQESTLKIQSMIEQLQSGTRKAVEVMESSSRQATRSVEHANSAGQVLEELIGLVSSISDMNSRIATSAEQQNATAASISSNIGNMISAAEQSATVAQNSVEDSARAMALASETQSMLKRFHIDQGALERIKKEKNHVLFYWNETYSVGIAEIDRQHKVLIALINELYHEVQVGSDHYLLGRVLQGLIDYTVSHFGYEEGLMERHGYEDLAAHKVKHKKLVGEVLEFQTRLEAREEGVVDKLLAFLSDWLGKHIQGTDKHYAAVLRAKGVS